MTKEPYKITLVGDHNLADPCQWTIKLDDKPIPFVERVEVVVDAKTGEHYANLKLYLAGQHDLVRGMKPKLSFDDQQALISLLRSQGYSVVYGDLGWKPISTAPTDGQEVELFGRNKTQTGWKERVIEAMWSTDEGSWCAFNADGTRTVLHPNWVWTHWRTPQCPEAIAEDEPADALGQLANAHNILDNSEEHH